MRSGTPGTFAMETYYLASDGVSAVRIEEEVMVTESGAEIMAESPTRTLFVANRC